MRIEQNAFVALDFKLTIGSGETVDQSEQGQPLTFVFGAGQMVPGLERQIKGMEAGQTAKIEVTPEEGYGQPLPELFREITRDRFPAEVDIQPGMLFQAEGPHGTMPMMVRSVDGDTVTIDLNHPLAGQVLSFDIKVVEVRTATEEELQDAQGCCGEEHECHGCGCH